MALTTKQLIARLNTPQIHELQVYVEDPHGTVYPADAVAISALADETASQPVVMILASEEKETESDD